MSGSSFKKDVAVPIRTDQSNTMVGAYASNDKYESMQPEPTEAVHKAADKLATHEKSKPVNNSKPSRERKILPIVNHINCIFAEASKKHYLDNMAYSKISLQRHCLLTSDSHENDDQKGLTQIDCECFFDPDTNQLIIPEEMTQQYLPCVPQSTVPLISSYLCIEKSISGVQSLCQEGDGLTNISIPKSTLSDHKALLNECIIAPANKAIVKACISVAKEYEDPFLNVVHNDETYVRINKHRYKQYIFSSSSPDGALCPVIQFSHLARRTTECIHQALDQNELVQQAKYIVTDKYSAYKTYDKTNQFCCIHAYRKLLEQLTPCFSQVYSMIEELVEKEKVKLLKLYDKDSPDFNKLIAEKEQEIQALVIKQLDSNIDNIETKDLLAIVTLFYAIFQYEAIHRDYRKLLNYGDKQHILTKLEELRSAQDELFDYLEDACQRFLEGNSDFAKAEVKYFLKDIKSFRTGMKPEAIFIPIDNNKCELAIREIIDSRHLQKSFVNKTSLDSTLEYLSFTSTLKANGFTNKEIRDLIEEIHFKIFFIALEQEAKELYQRTGSIANLNNVMKSMSLRKASKDFDFQSFMEKKIREKVEQNITLNKEKYEALAELK